MRRLMGLILAGAGLAASSSALAQNWDRGRGDYDRGSYSEHRSYDDRGDYAERRSLGDGGGLRRICSGQRANSLESQLRRADIDRYTERRIRSLIDTLQSRERGVCATRDWREIRTLAGRYDTVERWIGNAERQAAYRR